MHLSRNNFQSDVVLNKCTALKQFVHESGVPIKVIWNLTSSIQASFLLLAHLDFKWSFMLAYHSSELVLHHRKLVSENHHGSTRRPGLVYQTQEDATETLELHRLGFDSRSNPCLPTCPVNGHGQTGFEVDPRLWGLQVDQVWSHQPDRELKLVGHEREELL